MTLRLLAADIEPKLTWTAIADAIEAGHRLPKAQIGDVFLGPSDRTLLSRAAWIDGLGFGVKSVTVMADNASRGLPTVHGIVTLFEDENGQPEAVIDSDVVTKWKTAGDSVLGARMLARPDSEHLLIIGAGVVAESLVHAYSEIFPGLKRISLWNRTPGRAEDLTTRLADAGLEVGIERDLPQAVGAADIIATATMTREPVLKGDWVQLGTHVDLIGAFRADMREADDALMVKARLFVDSRDTTIGHIGELMIPMQSGVLSESDVLADFYDLAAGVPGRQSDDEITVFKNGGGAHLDLMTARHMLAVAGNA